MKATEIIRPSKHTDIRKQSFFELSKHETFDLAHGKLISGLIDVSYVHLEKLYEQMSEASSALVQSSDQTEIVEVRAFVIPKDDIAELYESDAENLSSEDSVRVHEWPDTGFKEAIGKLGIERVRWSE